MGIVIKQSFRNTITTYIGFAFGAVNALFLYTNFLTKEYYGLVIYLLSVANILMPLMTFGVQNTFVKFYSSYKSDAQRASFTLYMLLFPLIFIIPVGLLGIQGYEFIASFLAKENELVQDYVWMIYATSIAMAYFEVFFAWAKVQMKTVAGNFLKEVFHRVVVTVLLLAVYMDYLSVTSFIWALAVMYFCRTLIMLAVALKIKKMTLSFKKLQNFKSVFNYSLLIILAGSIANILLEIDKFMIGQYKALDNVAFYTVAIFIVTVIAVPSRAMHQITYPLTASLMNDQKKEALRKLYKQTALNLFIIGGGIFLLIVLNIKELYKLLPSEYGGEIAVLVVFIVGLARLSDALLGNANAIIFNSDFYKSILFFGILLALLTVGLNIVFIPKWGVIGAAVATLIAFLIYNIAKISFIYIKFKIHPFSHAVGKSFVVLLLLFMGAYFWDFPWHAVINIILKSVMLSLAYLFLIIRFSLSDDITSFINQLIQSIKRKN